MERNPESDLPIVSSASHIGWPRRLKLIGYLVLLIGLGSSVAIWRAQERMDRRNASFRTNDISGYLSPDDSRRYTREVEIYYGKTGVLFERWTRKAETLAHGKPLAVTIAIVSILAAASCFLFAAVQLPEELGSKSAQIQTAATQR